MSFAEIEAELENLTADELRRIAIKSWNVYVQKEGESHPARECDEEDNLCLASLDDAIAKADAAPGQGHSVGAVREQLRKWISK